MRYLKLLEESFPMLVKGLGGTVQVTVISLLIATLLGLFCCLLQISGKKPLQWISQIYIDVMRGVPVMVLSFFIYFGVPNGLENSIFQIGKILVASIVSGFGTISITANAVAGNLASLQVIPGMALGMAMITVVGQCIGAKDYEAVKKYTKKLMLITYGVVWAMTLLMLLFSKQILSFYSLSEETTTMTMEVFIVHGICAVIVWPLAFALPNALRAANDVRFTMIVSLLSMWIFRIGFSYILAIYFNMGILGTWIAMCIDWFCRGACFVIRFARGKWKNISFIDN